MPAGGGKTIFVSYFYFFSHKSFSFPGFTAGLVAGLRG
jgi:hypothetical protein